MENFIWILMKSSGFDDDSETMVEAFETKAEAKAEADAKNTKEKAFYEYTGERCQFACEENFDPEYDEREEFSERLEKCNSCPYRKVYADGDELRCSHEHYYGSRSYYSVKAVLFKRERR